MTRLQKIMGHSSPCPSPFIKGRGRYRCNKDDVCLKTMVLRRAQAKFLRRLQTKPEQILWKCLRAKRFHAFKFRRQVPIGNYIVDFYCAKKRLIIEIDGDVHS